MKSKILSILFVVFFFAFGASFSLAQSGTSSATSGTLPGTGSPTTTTIDPTTLLQVLKLAAKDLKVNADVLVSEYSAGNCGVCCLDPKAGAYQVQYGGGTIIVTINTSF